METSSGVIDLSGGASTSGGSGGGLTSAEVTALINQNVDNRDLVETSELSTVVPANQDAAALSFAGVTSEAVDFRVTTGAITSDIALGGADSIGNTAGLMTVADKVKLDALPKNELYELAHPATAINKYFKLGEITFNGSYRWVNFKIVMESRICSAEFFLAARTRADLTLVEIETKGYALGTSAIALTHDNLGNLNLYILLRAWSPELKLSIKEVSKNIATSYQLDFEATPHDSDAIGSIRPVDTNLEFIFTAIN